MHVTKGCIAHLAGRLQGLSHDGLQTAANIWRRLHCNYRGGIDEDIASKQIAAAAQVEGADEAAAIVAHRAAAAGGAAMEGAMLGRAAWKRPWHVLADADRHVFGAPANAAVSRRQARQPFCLARSAGTACCNPLLHALASKEPTSGSLRRTPLPHDVFSQLLARLVTGHASLEVGVTMNTDIAVYPMQVLREYAAFADPQLGRWQRRADGSLSPSARAMAMPLLQLFHGEPGGKQWKTAVDASLRSAATVAQVRACFASDFGQGS